MYLGNGSESKAGDIPSRADDQSAESVVPCGAKVGYGHFKLWIQLVDENGAFRRRPQFLSFPIVSIRRCPSGLEYDLATVLIDNQGGV